METTDKVLAVAGAVALAILLALWHNWIVASDTAAVATGECMVRFQRERNVTPETAWALCMREE